MNPARLIPPHLLGRFPSGLAAEGSLPEARPRTLAIVGSRAAVPEALLFARNLAAEASARGIVVVSGGALGIDTAAHEGALDAGGATWLVSPVPLGDVTPIENALLFARTVASGGAVITRQRERVVLRSPVFFRRNELLVALSDAVVVVQAGHPSGALNAAKHALELEVPLWAVPGSPWYGDVFAGSNGLLAGGRARALWRSDDLFASLGVGPARTVKAGPQLPLEAAAIVSCVDEKSIHIDEIIEKCGLPPGELAVHLLTLEALGVVLEGPPGFYRRPR